MRKEQLVELREELKVLGKSFRGVEKFKVYDKDTFDLVTDVDLEVSAKLEKYLPTLIDVPVLSEEQDDVYEALKTADTFWAIDPVDGTHNFIRGLESSSITVAYVENREVLFGIIYDPYKENFYYAFKGEGAYKNGERIGVSQEAQTNRFMGAFGFPNSKENFNKIEKVMRISEQVLDLKRIGSASLDICKVAEGIFDFYMELDLKPWDTLAASLVLKEAGGGYSNWDGEEAVLLGKEDYFCSSPNAKDILRV